MVETFDYVIVGGGTAGLVVANRLSDTPTVRVAVIEPGGDERNNPNVTIPTNYMKAYNTPIDWAYRTVPQLGVNNEPLIYHQGRAIGGTSTINAMAYIRANEADLDAWEKLGNPGWNWASLYPYYKRSENFTIPGPGLQASGVTFDASVHGNSGPVRTGYLTAFGNLTLMPTVQNAWEELGIPHNVDSGGGNIHGVSTNPLTIEPAVMDLRWDAAQAYWYPVEERPNLRIIKGTAQRLVWADAPKSEEPKDKKSGGISANGVEYMTEDGQAAVVSATKEVILSAGSLISPLILEASGVGNPSILKDFGIPIRVNLPGVGENFQDQGNNFFVYSTTAEATGVAVSQAFASPADIFGSNLAEIASSTRNELPRWADQIVSASGDTGVLLNKSAVETVLRVQHDLVFGESATTLAEFLVQAMGDGTLVSQFWTLFPFSRGSVHLASADLSKINEFVLDPRFNLVDFDITAQILAAKLAARLGKTGALSSLTAGRIQPSLDVLPENATNAQWAEFIKTTMDVDHHNIGTTSMMSRDLGGVVDPELRVYGTANVRVVDMSIIPLHFSGHPTATLYAVAERAADIIKRSPLYAA
ncbi:hypothetical protein F4680DRAFT_459964 [Xylaria scruposa]|nr:hypothetical protein F4680DRAFT_459964 [Xylaria scruposa]